MGRHTKTLLPTSYQLLISRTIKPEIVQSQLKQQRNKQKHYYDQHTRRLPELKKGDQVKIQGGDGKWRSATITEAANTPRSYVVTTPEGSTYRRNRRHINKEDRMEDSYLSDDDGHNQSDAPDCSKDRQAESTDQSPAHSSTHDAPTPAPVWRSTRNIRQPLRYDDTW